MNYYSSASPALVQEKTLDDNYFCDESDTSLGVNISFDTGNVASLKELLYLSSHKPIIELEGKQYIAERFLLYKREYLKDENEYCVTCPEFNLLFLCSSLLELSSEFNKEMQKLCAEYIAESDDNLTIDGQELKYNLKSLFGA